jgi:formylglycine-generating enzyme required for sulfatase activity
MTRAIPRHLEFAGLTALALLCAASSAAQPAAKPATRPVADRIPRTTVDLQMVRVPGGRITFNGVDGKEQTTDVKPFLIQQTEHRWEQWDVFYHGLDLPDDKGQRVGENKKRLHAALGPSSPFPYDPLDRNWGHDGWPVMSLTPKTIGTYIAWLNKATGRTYRLPTEAEWEWACRAGAAAPFKPTEKELDRYAWFEENSDERSHKVASKAPNAWGLYDMLGNVAEWVVPAKGEWVMAGGSFESEAADVHSGAREVPDLKALTRRDPKLPKDTRWFSDGAKVGFRLVRDVPVDAK